jgi:hypothetical protein
MLNALTRAMELTSSSLISAALGLIGWALWFRGLSARTVLALVAVRQRQIPCLRFERV